MMSGVGGACPFILIFTITENEGSQTKMLYTVILRDSHLIFEAASLSNPWSNRTPTSNTPSTLSPAMQTLARLNYNPLLKIGEIPNKKAFSYNRGYTVYGSTYQIKGLHLEIPE